MSNMTLLLCENHTELRWCCKTLSINEHGRYTHERNITFFGQVTPDGGYSEITTRPDGSKYLVKECDCDFNKLISVEKYGGINHDN